MTDALDEILTGRGLKPLSDVGPADSHMEGTYRRGYHQAIAEVMRLLRRGEVLTAESLEQWVEGEGRTWRHISSLDRQIIAPDLSAPVTQI